MGFLYGKVYRIKKKSGCVDIDLGKSLHLALERTAFQREAESGKEGSGYF